MLRFCSQLSFSRPTDFGEEGGEVFPNSFGEERLNMGGGGEVKKVHCDEGCRQTK
jgi:hypothetical protein